jgi:flagellar biosynthesis GTPase FlhF
MRVKSYYAATVEAAISLASKELGEEALLVYSREAATETRHLGRYEVVFALPEAPPPLPLPPAMGIELELAALTREVRGLRDQMAELSRTPTIPEEALHSMVTAAPSLGRVVALIGPPGSGKTTTLVKLAARFGLSGRRPAQLISFDTCRICGPDQLKTYAGILGMSFDFVETAGALDQVLEENLNKDLILIDTAGYSNKDLDTTAELEKFFAMHPQVDVHLTLSASMKPADLSRAADRFERFRPNRLLFTHLDETETYGSLWSEAVTRGKPVSYLCDGQQIPEDLHEATSEGLAQLILRRQSEKESCAVATA